MFAAWPEVVITGNPSRMGEVKKGPFQKKTSNFKILWLTSSAHLQNVKLGT